MGDQHHTRKSIQDSNQMGIDRLTNLPNNIIYHILSLMDTKSAVQTCVLSKEWTNHWTNIRILNFNFRSFTNCACFIDFVLHVLHYRKPSNLHSLSFHCKCSGCWPVVDIVFDYARSHNLDELETDLIDFPSSLYELQTLRTLTMRPCSTLCLPYLFGYSSLTTLQLFGVWLPYSNYNLNPFSNCQNLEKLMLIRCYVSSWESFTISGPRLVNLTISSIKYLEGRKRKNLKLVISAPRLEFLNLDGNYPLVFGMEKCPLDKVNIRLFPLVACYEIRYGKQEYILDRLRLVEGSYRTRSLKISMTIFREMREELLLFSSAVARGLAFHQLATELQEILEENRSKLASMKMNSHDIDVDNKVEWSATNEGIFIQILHDHVKIGDLQTSTFSEETWSLIDDELQAKANIKYTIQELKSKFNLLYEKHREFLKLIKHIGISWDPMTNIVTASEDVWTEYIKIVPGVKPYREQGFQHYNLLGEIFNNCTTRSWLNFNSSKLPPSPHVQNQLEADFFNSGVRIDIHGDELMDPPAERNKRKEPSSELDNYLNLSTELMNY